MELVLRVLSFVVLAGLAFAPLERVFGRRRGPRPNWLTDLGFATVGRGLVQLGLAGALGATLAILQTLGRPQPLWAGIADAGIRTIVEVATGLLVFDIMGYAYHRAAHAVPALWRLHAVHHSSESMDWLASFRQHPLETILVTLVQNAPLVLLGIPLASHALVLGLLRLHTVFVHADVPLGNRWWSRLIACPYFHHRHHQRDGQVRNYAALFPWLDRLLGTYAGEPAGPVGVRESMPRSFVGLLVVPFVRPVRRAPREAEFRPLCNVESAAQRHSHSEYGLRAR